MWLRNSRLLKFKKFIILILILKNYKKFWTFVKVFLNYICTNIIGVKMRYSNEKLNNILEKIDTYKDNRISIEYLIQDLEYLVKSLKVEDQKSLAEIRSELATIEMIYFYALLEIERSKEDSFKENDLEEIDKSLNSILKIINFALTIK